MMETWIPKGGGKMGTVIGSTFVVIQRMSTAEVGHTNCIAGAKLMIVALLELNIAL